MPSLADLLLRTVDGIFAVDPRQRIVFWDAGCERLFGVPARAALGRPCSEVVRGKNPLEQPVCGAGCCAATFADNPNVPGSFPLRARSAGGEELRLSVILLLVPALRKEERRCVHLLRRGEPLEPLLAFGEEARSAGLRAARAEVLTAREREILGLLAEGLGVRAISRLMRISAVTVRNHVQHIEKKLAVHSQAEAVAYAYRHNLL